MQTWLIVTLVVVAILGLIGLVRLGERQARAKGHVPRGVLSSQRVIRQRRHDLRAARRVGGSQAVIRSWVRSDPSTQRPRND